MSAPGIPLAEGQAQRAILQAVLDHGFYPQPGRIAFVEREMITHLQRKGIPPEHYELALQGLIGKGVFSRVGRSAHVAFGTRPFEDLF